MQAYPGRPTMSEYTGSCLCGTVRFVVTGSFDSFFLCHCHYCQKDTGSAHAANLFSRSATLSWQVGEEVVTSFTLPGTRHSKRFCQLCGSALPGADGDGTLVVPAGSLDSAVTFPPVAHLFTASKAEWDNKLETLPAFETLPT